jgi:hypothetical protein
MEEMGLSHSAMADEPDAVAWVVVVLVAQPLVGL